MEYVIIRITGLPGFPHTFLFEYVSISDCSTSVCFITSMVWVTSELLNSTVCL